MPSAASRLSPESALPGIELSDIELSGTEPLLRNGWRSWGVLLASWILPALAISAALLPAQPSMAASLRTAAAQLLFHLFFAALCPPIYQLSRRYRFSRGDWKQALAAHLAAALAVVVAASVFAGLMRVALGEKSIAVIDAIRQELTLENGRLFVVIFYVVIAGTVLRAIRLGRERELEKARSESLGRRAAELEAQLAQARLRTLEMQLQPHFLFNALNSIASLVEQQRGEEAYGAIARLGDLLRRTLDQPPGPWVDLDREMAWIEDYLELERLRFSDRLHVALEIETACRPARVPAMLLQPLVENAVRHALGTDPATTTIRVSARRRADSLILEVTDDGPGLPPGFTLLESAGVGLANVLERLEVLFDGSAVLELAPAAGCHRAGSRGVTARLELPWHEEIQPRAELQPRVEPRRAEGSTWS